MDATKNPNALMPVTVDTAKGTKPWLCLIFILPSANLFFERQRQRGSPGRKRAPWGAGARWAMGRERREK